MNTMLRTFINKFTFAFTANIISMLVSVITTFLLPKVFSGNISQYGYLQVFLFYVGYIGLLHFGLCDGLYLRDGGLEYGDLDKRVHSSQFWLLVGVEIIIAVIMVLYLTLCIDNIDYVFIGITIALTIVIVIPRTLIDQVFIATGLIKEYSFVVISNRLMFLGAVLLLYFFNIKNYKMVILSYLISNTFSLLMACFWGRDMVFCLPVPLSKALSEAGQNIRIGINLLVAGLAGGLMLGIVQWGIQMRWSVGIYGKMSLILSITNLFSVFINAIALVLYPEIKHMNAEKLSSVYGKLRDFLMIPLLGLMVLYYPIRLLISLWLPEYADSFKYLAVLFPLCLYSSKMSMLIVTYLKALRYEKILLKSYVLGCCCSLFTTIISVFVLKNLTLSMLAIVVNQMFCCIYAEYILANQIQINIMKDMLLEGAMTVVFIVTSWYIGGWVGVVLYACAYLGYVAVKEKTLPDLVKYLRIGKYHGQNRF